MYQKAVLKRPSGQRFGASVDLWSIGVAIFHVITGHLPFHHTIDDRMKVRSEVAVVVDRLFREENITIPFPQQDLHLRSIDRGLQPMFGVQTPQAKSEAEGPSE